MLILLPLVTGCANLPTSGDALCDGLKAPARNAARVAASEGSDAVVLAVDGLVTPLAAGCGW